jgi:thiamine-phosphate pyrophosphorylase
VPERVLDIAAAAVRGGADVLQLRHKSLPRGELLTLARRLRDAINASSPFMGRWLEEPEGREHTWQPVFIVNDHVDIALLSGADGVHLGPDDLTVASARRIAGDRLLIGASASTVERATQAVEEGADYVGSGPAFATPIKTGKQVIGPRAVAAIAQAVNVPVFAIGGIDESNLEQLTALGVRRACVIRAVSEAADPEQAASRLRAMLTLR